MVLGLDMGGSSLKVVSFDGTNVVSSARIPHRARGLDEVARVLAAAVPPGETFGVAVAGLVRAGVVLRSGNLELVDAPLQGALEARTGRKVAAFVSDAHATGRAALLEQASEGVVIALALGTGVGGALMEHGAIVRDEGLGHGTDAGEEAPAPCALGHARCLEAHLGAAALARAGGVARVEDCAPVVLKRAGELLGRALAPLIHPESKGRLVLSGGVAASSSLLEGASSTFPGPVVRARFGALTAAVGAALATRP
jgi:glucokinase